MCTRVCARASVPERVQAIRAPSGVNLLRGGLAPGPTDFGRPGPALSRPGKCPQAQWLNLADLAGNRTSPDPRCQHCGWQVSGTGTTGLGSWGLTPEILLELTAVDHVYQNPACKHLFGKAKKAVKVLRSRAKPLNTQALALTLGTCY